MIERLVDHRPFTLAAGTALPAARTGLESPPLPAAVTLAAATLARTALLPLPARATGLIPTRAALGFPAPLLGLSLGSLALA
jgi:hypothetical protein